MKCSLQIPLSSNPNPHPLTPCHLLSHPLQQEEWTPCTTCLHHWLVLQHKHVCILHTVCSWFQGNTSMMSSSGVMRDLLLAPTPVQDDTYMVKVTTSAHHTTCSVWSLLTPAYTHPSCWPSQQPADGGYVLGRQRFNNGGRSSQERLEYHMLVGY